MMKLFYIPKRDEKKPMKMLLIVGVSLMVIICFIAYDKETENMLLPVQSEGICQNMKKVLFSLNGEREDIFFSFFDFPIRKVCFEKEFSMNRTDAILFNCFIVSFCSIAFMLFKRVLRIALRKLIHLMISTDFSNKRGNADFR